MTKPRVSVVVVSRHRPKDLGLCLTALRQLYYPSFEIVVIADPGSLEAIADPGSYKLVSFDAANISEARNIGISHASGEIVAFIDDDAIAEPTWLDHLIAPFKCPQVCASGGYVIGRNGISLQWGALAVDNAGWTTSIPMDNDDPVCLASFADGQAIRTQGTNMAVRRSTLVSLGGFDPAYRFYHDEADLNVRLCREEMQTAVVPLARVHHKSSASTYRRSDRSPTTLKEIGASSAVFHRKYLAEREWARAREELFVAQRRRLDAMVIDGRLEPKSFEALLNSLLKGYDNGLLRTSGVDQELSDAPDGFRGIKPGLREHKIIKSRFLSRRSARKKAKEYAKSGYVTTLIILDPTARFHRQYYTKGGYWEYVGGIFGRSDRNQRYVKLTTFQTRMAEELMRISHIRNPF